MDNDRYSLLKELAPDKAGYNLFSAFQHDHPELSPEQAVDAAVDLRNRMMAVYVRLREQILPDASEQMTRYFEVLDLVIAGNIAFGTSTLRYFAPDSIPNIRITRTLPAALPPGPPPTRPSPGGGIWPSHDQAIRPPPVRCVRPSRVRPPRPFRDGTTVGLQGGVGLVVGHEHVSSISVCSPPRSP